MPDFREEFAFLAMLRSRKEYKKLYKVDKFSIKAFLTSLKKG